MNLSVSTVAALAREPGIYVLRNTKNGKVYVGSSVNSMYRRWQLHASRLRNGRHANPHLVAAWNKYGEGAFRFGVLEVVKGTDLIQEREQYWIDEMAKKAPGLYNMMPAERHIGGQVLTAEHRANISKANMGRVVTPETRRKISEAQKGILRGPMSKEAIRNSSVGHYKPYPAFRNENTGEMIPAGVGLQTMCEKLGFSKSTTGIMRKVIAGKKRMCKGWTLLDQEPWNKHVCQREIANTKKRGAAEIDRFWAHTDRRGDDECWKWFGGATARYKGNEYTPNRVSWMMFNGAIEDESCVLRRCLSGKCVNPAHLFLGTRRSVAEQRKARREAL